MSTIGNIGRSRNDLILNSDVRNRGQVEFPSDENWELRIEHWSDQTKSDQCSILNSQFSSEGGST